MKFLERSFPVQTRLDKTELGFHGPYRWTGKDYSTAIDDLRKKIPGIIWRHKKAVIFKALRKTVNKPLYRGQKL